MTKRVEAMVTRSGGTAWPFGPVGFSPSPVQERVMEARLSLRRLLLWAAAIVPLVAVTSACGGGAKAAAKDPPLLTYSGSSLSFAYPATWTAYPYRWRNPVLHFDPLVYLSTQPVHNPCSTTANETTCGFPIGQLQPGGVLVTWQFPYILPGFRLAAGRPIRVGGEPARRRETSGGICRRIGADRTVDIMIQPSTQPSNVIELTACLRGPGLAQSERRVNALLASTKFLSS